MSEIMRPIPFGTIIDWILNEHEKTNSVFGIKNTKFYRNISGNSIEIFGNKLSSPIGPAAGPNSQLAQNIIAAYLTGSRFMELKTVQTMDGEALSKCVPRPCINAQDEGYNVEWSTELTVNDAMEEYIKAWFALHVVSKEFEISNERDFAFNMSVGYDLEGIQSPKVDGFIEGLKDASKTPIWAQCVEFLKKNMSKFKNFNEKDLEKVSSCVASSITLSTLHGCPPEEIQKIATYFLTEKKVHTYIKCNPTLLGYDFARKTLDGLGFEYLSFTDHHFNNDLQYNDAIIMIKKLQSLAKEQNLAFGVKLTNTFPVKIENNELPGEEMYMSGRSLYPLTISLAAKLSKEFDGMLPISFSGGADHFNIKEIVGCGIFPITIATTILKPGGYERTFQLAQEVEPLLANKTQKIDAQKVELLAKQVLQSKFNIKSTRPVGSRKTNSSLPLVDCAKAPCKDGGCPINQQIPEYLELVSKNNLAQAFAVIANDNTAPSITGTICDHQCQNKCTRLDYDSPLEIRNAKIIAANSAQSEFTKNIVPAPLKTEKIAAIIGAGPAGIATALFLRRNGIRAIVFERKSKPYGAVSYTIPEFRISNELIQKDYDMAVAVGVEFNFNCDENFDINKLKAQYDFVVLAIGSWKHCAIPVQTGGENLTDALSFLEKSRKNNCQVDLGKSVAVIGGGDVAMDCARAAKRARGVQNVSIVYRRTKEFMPAEPEEKLHALVDGVVFQELLSPISFQNKTLVVEKMALSKRDESGRRGVVSTNEKCELAFDTVINATGARIQSEFFTNNNIQVSKYGTPIVDDNNRSSVEGVYIAGDCKAGAATIVKAIADGKTVAKDIIAKLGLKNDFVKFEGAQSEKQLYAKKGNLSWGTLEEKDGERCLACDVVCELCVDVCPNRANVMIQIDNKSVAQKNQILHVDGMCNECGNCGVFCPHTGNPYKDKITLFWTEHDFVDSTNKGFLRIGENEFKVRNEAGEIITHSLGEKNLSTEMDLFLNTVIKSYSFYDIKI